jgi:hypothetical protein
MDRAAKLRQLEELQSAVRHLEAELAAAADSEDAGRQWPPSKYYTAYHALAGFSLGMFGAISSLLFNVVGSTLIGQHPLQLIRVYLTFPLGEAALHVDSGVILAVGCCLYLATGMLLGIPFHLVLTGWAPRASFVARFLLVSGMALALWLFNFYGLLWWLQPLLFGGRWIVELIPPWVAALTHLVFAWTLLLVQPLGAYVPYAPIASKE